MRFLLRLGSAILFSFAPMVTIASGVKFAAGLARGECKHIVCYGTSLTAICGYPEALQDELDGRWPGKARVTNSGGSGQNSRWGIENLDKLVISNRPDVVFLEFSMNDSVDRFKISLEESEQNTRTIIGRIREALPKCEVVLMTMNAYTGEPASKRANLSAYYDIYRKLANEGDLCLIDNFPLWKDVLLNKPLDYRKMVPDGTHPNELGIRRVLIPSILRAILPSAKESFVHDIASGYVYGCRVVVRGYIRDVFSNENVPGRVFAILKHESDSLYIDFKDAEVGLDKLRPLISADITVEGDVVCMDASGMPFSGPSLSNCRFVGVNELEYAGVDPFSAKYLEDVQPSNPGHISALLRRRLCGRVLAVWGSRFLLQSELKLADPSSAVGILNARQVGREHIVTLNEGKKPPRPGMMVETVGFPATDLRRINLNSAIWRVLEQRPADDANESSRGEGEKVINGDVVEVMREPMIGLLLRCEAERTVVPLDACPEVCEKVECGSVVSVRGVMVEEFDEWHSYAMFPRLRRRLVVPRTAADVVIVKGVSWWTIRKLIWVVGFLLAVLVILVGRWLIDRRLASIRFADRTRLAVELHDSVSQNLTGVSMQIDAAREMLGSDSIKAGRRLDIASRTIDSCREQMRNCINDLRGRALDQADFGSVLSVMLEALALDSNLMIRFNVPRKSFSDEVVHAVVSIVRELSVNAVRHGHAANIRVAGALDAKSLSFSVTDDGCGFDPASRSGVAEGHFGLQGVAERVRRIGGKLEVESAPGEGCRVAVTLPRDRRE